jgi:RimJ/RimL family protein N-acetyltransferase
MTEATTAMLEAIFGPTDPSGIGQTVFGECVEHNIGSARVMEKAGLRLVARFQSSPADPERAAEMNLRYRISREEWHGRRGSR